MPKPLILPDPPAHFSIKNLLTWRVQFEVKRLLIQAGEELRWLNESHTPKVFAWWKTLMYSTNAGRRAKVPDLEELRMFYQMKWPVAKTRFRTFNYVWLITGKAKTDYELELERRLDEACKYMNLLKSEMQYGKALELEGFLRKIRPPVEPFRYPDIPEPAGVV